MVTVQSPYFIDRASPGRWSDPSKVTGLFNGRKDIKSQNLLVSTSCAFHITYINIHIVQDQHMIRYELIKPLRGKFHPTSLNSGTLILLEIGQWKAKIWFFLPFFFFFFFAKRAALAAYRSSQSRGQIGVTSDGLHHSHRTSDLSHVCNLHHSSRQRQIPNPLSQARDRTHNLMVPSHIPFPLHHNGNSTKIWYVLDELLLK